MEAWLVTVCSAYVAGGGVGALCVGILVLWAFWHSTPTSMHLRTSLGLSLPIDRNATEGVFHCLEVVYYCSSKSAIYMVVGSTLLMMWPNSVKYLFSSLPPPFPAC